MQHLFYTISNHYLFIEFQEIQIGTEVRIGNNGIVHKINGKKGIVVGIQHSKRRFLVKLNVTGTEHTIEPKNIRRV